MQPVSDRKPLQFRLWYLFALVTGSAVVFSVFSFLDKANRRFTCVNNLKIIGLALQSYHDIYGCFPPPYVSDAQGKPLYSWRVLILPWMEQRRLYDKWRFDEPWDSPHNQRLPGPGLYECPTARRNRRRGAPPHTDYLAVVGPGMAWEEGKSLPLDDFTDIASNTIMLVEVRGSQIHWAEPVDFDGTASLKINASRGLSIGSHHAGGAHVYFADGSIVHLPDTTSEDESKALLTRDGGEHIDWDGSGEIRDHTFETLYWLGESWNATAESWIGWGGKPFRGVPFSIDFDDSDPTNQDKLRALAVARKAYRRLDGRVNIPWKEKAKLHAAKEVTEATSRQFDDTPTEEDLQRLVADMTVESWGMTYATDDATVSPYVVYTSPKHFPNVRIRIEFTTDLTIDEVMVIPSTK